MSDPEPNFPFDAPPPGDPAFKALEKPEFQPGLSLTRMLVGGILLGMDAVMDRLIQADLQRYHSVGMYESEGSDEANTNVPDASRVIRYEYGEETEKSQYALVGLVFVTRDKVLDSLDWLDRAQRKIGARFSRLTKPIQKSPLVNPIQRRFDGLVRRGEEQINQLVLIGERESQISRQIAKSTLVKTVDGSIDYLAGNESVRDLVQSQSTGLADEAIEEIRERSVSADNFVEGLTRYLLRRLPRQELPPPPEEVRAHAERLHPERAKKK